MPLSFILLLTFSVGFGAGYLSRAATVKASGERFASVPMRRRAF
jgi:hypothetical protein